MSNDAKWTNIDKRILDRRLAWSAEEKAQYDKQLNELPDCSDKLETIDIPQPAFEQPQEEAKEEAAADAPADAPQPEASAS